MRVVLALLMACLALVGCLDAVGLGGSCMLEMREVQRREGRGPDHRIEPREISDGNYEETWRYEAASGSDRIYIFRWGVSYESCDVTRTSLNLAPALLL